MTNEYIVVGHFEYVDDTQKAIAELRKDGIDQLELFTPYPNHDLEDEMYRNQKRSPVRMITLTGAVTGCLGAFLMTSWMSVDWPLRVSAKPLLSYPAFVIIAFECTILIGSIFNLLGMFHFSRIPHIFRTPGFRPNFTEGTFGLTARVSKDRSDAVKSKMEKLGAANVEVGYVR